MEPKEGLDDYLIGCDEIDRLEMECMNHYDKKRWVVRDNGKLALQSNGEWDNCRFLTFRSALAYANNWLGIYGPFRQHRDPLQKDIACFYSGYGDVLTITLE